MSVVDFDFFWFWLTWIPDAGSDEHGNAFFEGSNVADIYFAFFACFIEGFCEEVGAVDV